MRLLLGWPLLTKSYRFACDVGKFMTMSGGLMDTKLYDYVSVFGTGLNMTKAQRIATSDSYPTHAMSQYRPTQALLSTDSASLQPSSERTSRTAVERLDSALKTAGLNMSARRATSFAHETGSPTTPTLLSSRAKSSTPTCCMQLTSRRRLSSHPGSGALLLWR